MPLLTRRLRDRLPGPVALGVPAVQVLAAVLVAAHVGFRAWAVLPSWFYLDDYRMLAEAREHDLDLAFLLSPYDSQLMPLGRALADLLSRPEVVQWHLLATTTLVMQLLATASCAWMLGSVFGWRAGILLPLGLFVTNAMTLPATMWWAAGLNQLPLQTAFFLAVGAWVRYLRGGSRWWLLATFAAVGLGLTAYVKAALVLAVLAYLVLAYFAAGPLHRRAWSAVRRYWVAVAAGLGVGVTYTVYYVTQVPQLSSGDALDARAGALADRMLATSLPTGIFGGPWRWAEPNPPVGLADPPAWTVHLAWVLAAVVVAYLAARRTRTGRAWGLLGLYAAAAYVLVLLTRAPIVGAIVGLEYRYLTDTTCALVLALGLATMSVPGSVESSEPRTAPLLTVRAPRPLVALLVVSVLVSGLWSSWSYARIWHLDNPGEDYFGAAVSSLAGGPTDLAEQTVEDNLVPGFLYPYNSTPVLLPLLTPNASFPTSTPALHLLDEDGHVRAADLDVEADADDGPLDGCGWRVREGGLTVDLDGATSTLTTWVRLGYLVTEDSPLVVEGGLGEVETEVFRGLGTVWVLLDGGVDQLRFSGLGPGVTLCLDTIEAGTPEPEEVP